MPGETGVFVAVVVIWLLFVVAEFVFVFLMRGGRNWARIVLAVLGGLGVLWFRPCQPEF